MDPRHLDDLARKLGSQAPRRSVLGALGGLAALLAAPALDSAAKKKKHRKKKCKGNKKKCGKKCIPADKCCTTADCGSKGSCVNGTCVCPTGQKPCNGGCIPTASCCQNGDCGPTQTCINGTCTCSGGLARCGQECIDPETCCGTTCPGNQTCDEGFCFCPNPDDWPCGDGSCVTGSECCVSANCPADQHCDDGTCWCNVADGIWCDTGCCDAAQGETCTHNDEGASCVAGGCALNDWCNVDTDSVCRDSATEYCVCITSYGPTEEIPACVDGYAIGESCETCETNDDCDAGYACVQGDTSPDGYCGCGGKFCARLCDAEPQRGPRRANASARHSGRKKVSRTPARR